MDQKQRQTSPIPAELSPVRVPVERRRSDAGPPPEPERIREQLGWWLIPGNPRGTNC